MTDLDLFDSAELLALARLDLQAQRVDAALLKLKKAKTFPSYPADVDAALAKIYAQLDLFATAEDHFRLFLTKVPDALLERFQWGMVQFEQNRLDEALAIWAQVLETAPIHPPALYYSAVAQLQSNQEESARQLLERLLKTAPADNLYFQQGKRLLQDIDSRSRESLKDMSLVNTDMLYN